MNKDLQLPLWSNLIIANVNLATGHDTWFLIYLALSGIILTISILSNQ